MLRIYGDFNTRDEEGRVLLNTVGSLRDIARYQDLLTEGMVVTLNIQDEFEVKGTLVFDQVWRAIPDLSEIHYLDKDKQE